MRLNGFTTLNVGGRANCFLEISTLENFLKVMFYLEEKGVKVFVLGAGSKILVSDKGFDGVVVKLVGDFARIEELDKNIIECGAGVLLASAFAKTKELGLSGFQQSVGIPATIGGAVYMNASAYDFEMSKLVKYVVAFVDGKLQYFSKDDCQFGYRKSVFQTNHAIILRVGLNLESQDREQLMTEYRNILMKRNNSQPIQYRSAGSVFKRQEGIVVSKVLEECGLKGLKVGGAEVSDKHANFIINKENATAQDIYDLIQVCKKNVRDKAGLNLEEEIIFLGEFDEITG
jgi:UDP-N-acetylmuramate dehydrogenase